MKKFLFSLGSVAFLSIALTSCAKKDYTCTCTGNGFISRTIIPDATKAQAETICKAGEVYQQGSTNSASCGLD